MVNGAPGASDNGPGDDERRRASDLFQYLRAFSRLRLREVSDTDQWEQVIWLDRLTGPANCRTHLDDPDMGEFVRVERVVPPDPPTLPPALEPWVEPEQIQNWKDIPDLRQEADPASEDGGPPPEVEDAWTDYLERWMDWAANRAEIQPGLDIYRELFKAQRRASQLGEQYEVVIGIGHLNWRLPDSPIRRHLIAAPASIVHETGTGLISVVTPEVGDVGLRIEDEMVPGEFRPPTGVLSEFREALANTGDPFGSSVKNALRRWVHGADASGAFLDELRPSRDSQATPRITFAPAVILRQRRARTLDETFDGILRQLEDSDDIPAAVRDLLTDTAEARCHDDLAWTETGDTPEPPPRTFFPLPTNPQQHDIVEILARSHGVVVHGPPGTGKTHTIANLISHCLATGNRVLVTSYTDRALRVLKEQLPEDIRDLTVSILGTGRTGAEDLRNSAEKLLARRGDPRWSVNSLDETISGLKARLEDTEESRAKLRADLARYRAAASESHQLPSDFSGPLGEIASQLAAARGADGWLPDRVDGPMPITHAELAELCELHERVRDIDEELASTLLPSRSALPTTEELQAVQSLLNEANQFLRSTDHDSLAVERLLESGIDLSRLDELLRDHDLAEQAVRRREEEWLNAAMTDSDAGRTNTWEDLEQRTRAFLERDAGHRQDGAEVGAVSPARLPALRNQADQLIAFLENGGNLHRRFPRPSAVRRAQELLEDAPNLGVDINGLESAREAQRVIVEFAELNGLQQHWGGHLELTRGTLAHVRGRLRDALTTLDHLATVWEARTRLSDLVGVALGDPIDTAGDVTHLAGACVTARAARAWETIRGELASINDDDAPAIVRDLINAALELRIDDYRQFLAELDELRCDQYSIVRFSTLRDTLATVAPSLTEDLLEGRTELPQADEFDRAWRWSWAMSDIEHHRNSNESALASELHRVENESRSITAELTCKLAWRNTLAGLSGYEVQELRAYQKALRRVGKGRGRQASTNRREAQRHLDNCRSAIPAWIMPTYRVAETLTATPESFDVVIVDEASQSGIDAMFLFWLGKKLVIVGDDNQISPSTIGVRAEDVSALQGTHLGGFGLRDLLGVDSSLFDQAVVRFATSEVWLTEHFRCMPEIIEFSNRLLYAPQNRRLEPLRQFGSDRLPPLVRRWVPGGEREGGSGRVVNRAEADELVSALLECDADPSYDGMTFGVIGLLGGQADYIEARLFERLPPDVWDRRRLRCGDAYDFQGDERHVIFLSMVASLEDGRSRIPRLGHDRYMRQYNVAASRARDQMWLFHSMTLEQLAPDCPRFALLNHFINPPDLAETPFDGPVERDVPHPRFDSLFEQRIFLDIRERGYAVVPQYEAYGRRIDIVVVGSAQKLAVECDGAEWHGADRYAEDLARQRDLERAGWTFFRVRDIDYYLDPESVLEPLWGLLQQHGIHPRGMGGTDDPLPPDTDPSPPAPAKDASSFDDDDRASEESAPTVPSHTEPTHRNVDPPTYGDPSTPAQQQFEAEATGAAMRSTYETWVERAIPPIERHSTTELATLLVEIIDVEGPVIAERVYRLANRAAGSTRLGRIIRSKLDRAVQDAIQRGQVVRTDPLADGDPLNMTLRLPHQPPIRARARGSRESLNHVPPEELRSALDNARQRTSSTEDRYRFVLNRYEFRRLTDASWELLRRCEQIPDQAAEG